MDLFRNIICTNNLMLCIIKLSREYRKQLGLRLDFDLMEL